MLVELNDSNDVYKLAEDTFIELGGVLYCIPKGFEWDGASIPNWLYSFIFVTPYHHTVRRAGLLHDYLYRKKVLNRRAADLEFLALMKQDGANFAQRTAMYLAVRAFGWMFYKRDK